MKIIHHGSLPEEREHRGTCGHCGTVVEFKEKEAQHHSDQREGSWFEIKCPTCRRTITVSA